MVTIDFYVGPGGKVKFDFNGFQGGECIKALEHILADMRAAGLDVTDVETTLKDEYNLRLKNQERQKVGA